MVLIRILLLFITNHIISTQSSESTHSSIKFEKKYTVKVTANSVPNALCFERLDNKSGQIYLVGHPGVKNRAVIGTQSGLMTLVSLPEFGSKEPIKRISTWLNLTSRVRFGGEQGLLSFAFHRNFLANGKFYVSYICDSDKFPDCKGPCACTNATGCDPTKAPLALCRYNTIVAEYNVGSNPKFSTSVVNKEEKRIFTFSRPYSNHNGGDIFFGNDGLLYYTSGDGGSSGDPWNFAQNGLSFMGKILRVDVNWVSKISNYSVPRTNPFVGVNGVLPEIYSLGLRNPWRCSIDKFTSVIICGDVGQNIYEEIDIIERGGNYGWRNFEGSYDYNETRKLVPNTPVSKMIGNLTLPIFQYAHSSIPSSSGAVIGGSVYRSNKKNKCLQGMYVYSDYLGPTWIATIYPTNGANRSTTRVSMRCDPNSSIKCVQGNGTDVFGIKYSWSQDNNRDHYLLSSNGIYRITDLKSCGIANC